MVTRIMKSRDWWELQKPIFCGNLRQHICTDIGVHGKDYQRKRQWIEFSGSQVFKYMVAVNVYGVQKLVELQNP